MVDTAAFGAALIHLRLGPDEQLGTPMGGFNKRINVISESFNDAKDAQCRDFSARWRTANRGVNSLAGNRSMLWDAVAQSPCMELFKVHEKCYRFAEFVAHLFDGK